MELIIGIAGSGTAASPVVRSLTGALHATGVARVTQIDLTSVHGDPASLGVDDTTTEALRARLAIVAVRQQRSGEAGDPDRVIGSSGRLVLGVTDREDVALLRRVFGNQFFLVASPAQLGKEVPAAFRDADLVVSAPHADRLTTRFVELMMGHPFHTPTRSEYALHHAHAASLRSSALRGQVGAVLVDGEGEIVAVGVNEVPRAGGGQYWSEDADDARDFRRGFDPATTIRRALVRGVVEQLMDEGLLDIEVHGPTAGAIADRMLGRDATSAAWRATPLADAAFESLGRVVHAELAAVLHAARRGTALARTTLYTTGFPCRFCLRHLVMAGIERIVYLPAGDQPAPSLHEDAVSFGGEQDGRVSVEPFEGVTPIAYPRLFRKRRRMEADGRAVRWSGEMTGPPVEEWLQGVRILGEWMAIAPVGNVVASRVATSGDDLPGRVAAQVGTALQRLSQCSALLADDEQAIVESGLEALGRVERPRGS